MPVAPEERDFQRFMREEIPEANNFDQLYSLFLLTPYAYVIPNALYILKKNWDIYQEEKHLQELRNYRTRLSYPY